MAQTHQDSYLETGFRIALCCVLVGCLVVFVALTLHWHLVNDPAQINYACFLMDHGMAPYKDLIEMNMPGIYMVNWSVMHTLGDGPLAWRFFDFAVTALAGLAMIWIAIPYDWLAGVFAAALFALFHGRDGPAQAGQRDLIIAMLLLWAVAFLFESFRRNRVGFLFFCTLCGTAAATIKPLAAPLVIVLIAGACVRLRQLGRPISQAIVWGVAGALVPLAAVFAFLSAKGSLTAFFYVFQTMLPFYVRLGRASMQLLVRFCLTPSVLVLVVLASVIAVLCRPSLQQIKDQRWEQATLLLGIGFGLFSYFFQGTGFPYHRYPMLAFIILWAGLQFCRGAQGSRVAQITAYSGLLFGGAIAPLYAARAAHRSWDEAYNISLAADLTKLGGADLSGRVLCLSTMADCDTTLYRLKLVQDTGLFYDYFVFGNGSDPVIARTRRRILPQLLSNPPKAIILSLGLYPRPADGYAKLATWPELDQYIAAHYTLYDDREFARAECGARGYRLYVLTDGEGALKSARARSSSPSYARAALVDHLC